MKKFKNLANVFFNYPSDENNQFDMGWGIPDSNFMKMDTSGNKQATVAYRNILAVGRAFENLGKFVLENLNEE